MQRGVLSGWRQRFHVGGGRVSWGLKCHSVVVVSVGRALRASLRGILLITELQMRHFRVRTVLPLPVSRKRVSQGLNQKCDLPAYVRTVRVDSVSIGDNQVLQNLQELSLASGVLGTKKRALASGSMFTSEIMLLFVQSEDSFLCNEA